MPTVRKTKTARLPTIEHHDVWLDGKDARVVYLLRTLNEKSVSARAQATLAKVSVAATLRQSQHGLKSSVLLNGNVHRGNRKTIDRQ